MKIRVLTDAGLWLGEQPRLPGYEADVPDEVAKAIIERGHAEEVKPKRGRAKDE